MSRTAHSTEYTIGSHFITALLYGDTSGLDDYEEDEIQTFEDLVQADLGVGHWAVPEDSESEFAMCEVGDIMSDCTTIEYVIIKES